MLLVNPFTHPNQLVKSTFDFDLVALGHVVTFSVFQLVIEAICSKECLGRFGSYSYTLLMVSKSETLPWCAFNRFNKHALTFTLNVDN